MHADAAPAEHLRPQLDQPLLRLVARRRRRAGGEVGRLRCVRQGPPVDLAVRRQGQRVQRHQGRGHQVVRHLRPQPAPQPGGEGRGAPPGPAGGRRPGPGGRHDVRHEPALARAVSAGHDQRLGHLVVLAQRRLDLPGLDPEAADLDLAIGPPEEVDGAVRAVPHEVAGLVEDAPRLVAERIGDEPLRRLPRQTEVAAGHAVAPDVQLPRHADGHRLSVSVQDVHPRVGDGPADGHRGPDLLGRRHGIAAGERGALGRAVAVHQPVLARLLEYPPHVPGREHVTAGQEVAHAEEGVELLLDHGVEQPGGQPEHGHAVPAQHGAQLSQARRLGRGDDQPRPVAGCPRSRRWKRRRPVARAARTPGADRRGCSPSLPPAAPRCGA